MFIAYRRSQQAMAEHAERVLRLFGHEPDRVVSFCGAEQEYFLVDRHFFLTGPDLLNAGRTLFGSKESLPTTSGRSRPIRKCFTS